MRQKLCRCGCGRALVQGPRETDELWYQRKWFEKTCENRGGHTRETSRASGHSVRNSRGAAWKGDTARLQAFLCGYGRAYASR